LFAVPQPHNKTAVAITAAVLRGLQALRIKLDMLMAFPLPVTDDAFCIIGPAVAFVTAAGVYLAVDLVQGQIIPAVYKFAVRPVAELDGRLDLKLVGMAVVAEGTFMAGRAELSFACRIETVVFDEILGMNERRIGLHGSPDLIFMTFGAYGTAFSELFHVPCGKGCFVGEQAACGYPKSNGRHHEKYAKLGPSHFFAPLLEYA
jgi:hypothetical protein